MILVCDLWIPMTQRKDQMENIYNDNPTDVTEHHLISFEANKWLNGNTCVVLGATDIKPHIFWGPERFLYGDSRNISVYCCKSGSVIFMFPIWIKFTFGWDWMKLHRNPSIRSTPCLLWFLWSCRLKGFCKNHSHWATCILIIAREGWGFEEAQR